MCILYEAKKIIPSSFNWFKDNSFLTPGTASRKHSNFMPDPGITLLFSADNSDYRGSGWSRGHMAPAGDNKFDQVNVLWYQLYLLGSIFIDSEYPVKVYQLESQLYILRRNTLSIQYLLKNLEINSTLKDLYFSKPYIKTAFANANVNSK